jgi:general secretion pathway protein G
MKYQKINQKGFTLIELMVVIAVIALLSSVALIAFQSARAKSRNAKRLSDMTQMNTALGLFHASNKGYPTSTGGIPAGLVPEFASTLPAAPQPPDGECVSTSYPAPVPVDVTGARYYYLPTGTSYLAPDGTTEVFGDYLYYFCLGDLTGNFPAGPHVLTPQGVK